MKKKIEARIIADSKNEHGQRITTFVLTYPRFIHAELLTHRLFSRNAASSRAIPAYKLIEEVENDPFIPVAFQQQHKGMQGQEYMTSVQDVSRCIKRWIEASKSAVLESRALCSLDITKQLTNRPLESFQWYTCIVTATEYENFFNLRCPQYGIDGKRDVSFRSRKDAIKLDATLERYTTLDWLRSNQGQGEIHISLLAEAMYDSMNESEPKELKAGEWHIPFGDKMDEERLTDMIVRKGKGRLKNLDSIVNTWKIKIAIARCARISYLNFEGKDDYGADVKLYGRLLEEGHMSPFEHCARAQTLEEYENSFHQIPTSENETGYIRHYGWSGNFRGFVQLRKEIE